MQRKAVLAVVAMVALAGCSLPAFEPSEVGTTSGSSTAPAPEGDGEIPDPDGDVKGWENGVWYNESLAVDANDGLNESELAMVVNRSMARVEYVREVEFERDVPVSVISREEYADRQSGDGGGDDAAAVREGARLEALFLVGERTDAGEEQSATRSATVQGFYSPTEDEITIVAPTDAPAVDEVTLAHELVHAYQFRGNLDVRFPQDPTRDERRALVALIEGDANYVDRKVRARCEGAWSCLGTDDGGTDDGGATTRSTVPPTAATESTAPPTTATESTASATTEAGAAGPRPNMGLYLLSYFPYAEGEEYVAAVERDGGWAAVNDLYADPPSSSEQVIHRVDDAAGSVSVRDRSTDAWSRVGGDADGVVMGEADVATMFAATLYDDREGSLVARDRFLTDDGPVPITYGLEPSDGWDGDRFHAYERDDGDVGYVWRLGFDSEAEARAFAEAYRDLLRYHDADRERPGVFVIDDSPYADAFAVDVDGDRVTIVNAPTVDDLDDVHEPAGE